MNSEGKIEELMLNDEQVMWRGRPLPKPYKIRNIERTLIDFTKLVIIVFLLFAVYYLLFQKEFFPKRDIYNFGLFLLIIFIFNIVTLIKKITKIESVQYCITNKRVLIINEGDKQNVRIVGKNEIKNKKIIDSATDRQYKVLTVKLVTRDEDAFLESIENEEQVMRLL